MSIDIETLRECIAVVQEIRDAHMPQQSPNHAVGWDDACRAIDTRLRQLAREIPE